MAEGPNRPLRAGDFLSIRPDHVMTHDNTSAVMKKFKAIGARAIHDPRNRCSPPITTFRTRKSRTSRSTAAWRRSRASMGSTSIRRAPESATRSWWRRVTCCRAISSSRRIRTPTCMERWARLARQWCAPTRRRSGRPASSGGRFRERFRWCLKANSQPGVTGKDVIITLCGLYNQDEVLNAAVEFAGPGRGVAQHGCAPDHRQHDHRMGRAGGLVSGRRGHLGLP